MNDRKFPTRNVSIFKDISVLHGSSQVHSLARVLEVDEFTILFLILLVVLACRK